MEDLMFDCEQQSKKLKVIDILTGLRFSANQIEAGKIKGDYYIIFINVKEHLVKIMSYSKSNFNQASEDYANIEKSITESEGAVVLVTSDSVISLKKAYPSYFLDTSEFIAAIQKINENCKLLKKTSANKQNS